MKPERLVITNIGPFRGSHAVDFTGLGDIFLVYGKTGAGKTTVFDALTYALYGQAPGSRKGLVKEMRSHFARDEEESSVELVFTLSGKRYRIRRVLPQEHIGVRSGKIRTRAEEVSFDEQEGPTWVSRTDTNKSETDRKIITLIALSEEEFSRIVLLPQGEFSRFLKQNSTERKQVLSKLFPVSEYGRVTELARVRAREAENRLKDTEAALLSLQEKFSGETYEEQRKQLTGSIERLGAETESARKQISQATVTSEQARQAERRYKAFEEQKAKVSVLEGQEAHIRAIEKEQDSARRAAPLNERLILLRQLEQKLAKTRIDRDRISVDRAETGKRLLELEDEKPLISSLSAEKNSLLLRQEQLRVAARIEETLEEEIAGRDRIKKQLDAVKKQRVVTKEEHTLLTQQIQALEDGGESLEICITVHAEARASLEKAKQLKQLAEAYEQDTAALRGHEQAFEAAETLRRTLERDLEIARAETEALSEEVRACARKESAAVLALALAEGQPCPVCGSCEHPAPAGRNGLHGIDAEERLEAAQRRIASLERDHARAVSDAGNRNDNRAAAQSRREEAVRRYCAAASADDPACIPADAIPSAEEAAVLVKRAAEHAQKTFDTLQKAQRSAREREELLKRKREREHELERQTDEIGRLEVEYAGLREACKQKEARYHEAFSDGLQPDGKTASEMLDRCSADLLAAETRIAGHADRLTETMSRHSALEATFRTLEESLDLLMKEQTETEGRFEAECRRAGFRSREEMEASVRTEEHLLKLEEETALWHREISAARSLASQLERETSAWNGPDPVSADAELNRLEELHAALSSQLRDENARLSSLDALKGQRDELDTLRSERSIEAGRFRRLADDLSGANPLNISFDAWILGMYLEEITAYANTRLERMSEGRYRIRLNDSYRKGNSLSGLDLEILDAYTGRARPSATLSGGETFMASISLALGLADSIQARSGGIQLDAVFIDEGFGSLDEASLERAIAILDEIRGSRMVGIVSHVAELRNRIPGRIEICKTGSGSTIRTEVY